MSPRGDSETLGLEETGVIEEDSAGLGSTALATDPALDVTLTSTGTTPSVGGDEGDAPGPGTKLGRFVVSTLLGRGGFGVVVAAHDPDLDRKVAIKLIRPALIESAGVDDARNRLLREARALAQLSHPNIVAVHEIGEVGDSVFVAMEFVPGETLGEWAETGRSVDDIVAMYTQAGRGLAAAHRAGIVHRDFKPDNAMYCPDGRVRVLDFGLARAVGAGREGSSGTTGELTDSWDVALTHAGAIAGTPLFMAPEQHRGEVAGARSDQFSFCVSLYRALFGQFPFAGNTLLELRESVTRGLLREPPETPGVPPSMVAALCKGLSVIAEDRHESMDELLALLGDTPEREAERLVAERWNSGTLTRVRGALERAGLVADDAAQVTCAMDSYAREWVGEYVEAQRLSADKRHTRIAMLWSALTALGALGDVLAGADATVASNALEAALQLHPLDVSASAWATPSLPGDIEQRGDVLRSRGMLARVRQLIAAGDYSRAASAMEDVDENTPYVPLCAEILAVRAELSGYLGKEDEAEEELWGAYLAADAGGNDMLRAQAAASLAVVVGDTLARPSEGHRWAEQAVAICKRHGGDTLLEAQIAVSRSRVAVREGHFDAAVAHAEVAVEMFVEALGQGHWEVAQARFLLGKAAIECARWELAEGELVSVISVLEGLLGPVHPALAEPLERLGAMWTHRGQPARAVDCMERAYGLAEASLTPDNSRLAAYLEGVAVGLSLSGQPERALTKLERARELRIEAFGPDHPDLARTLTEMGRAARAMGDMDRARGHNEDALALAVRTLGEGHPDLAAFHNNLGVSLMSMGSFGEAHQHHVRALAIRTENLGTHHVSTANSMTNVGRSLVGAGRLDEASAVLEQAIAAYDAIQHPFVAFALAALGEVRHRTGDAASGRVALERALEVQQGALGNSHPRLVELLEPLVNVCAAMNDHAGARAHLKRAVDIATVAHGADSHQVAKLQGRIAVS